MQLTTRDVTKFFNVAESTVQRWVKRRALPAHRVNGQLRFSRAELLEWATANRVPVSPELFESIDDEAVLSVSLAGALEAGGIHYGVPDSTKEMALREVVERMPLPANMDRQTLFHLFMAREALGSTAVGDGIAIPHVRSPLVLGVERPSITLCFLERPVDFGALDVRPVGVLFSMICPTVRYHLQLLARLSFALHDPRFKGAVLRQSPQNEILEQAQRIDAGLQARDDRPKKGIAD